MTLTSCSAEEQQGAPTAELCRSSLSAQAQEALDRLSPYDRYQNTGMSYDRAATRLRENADLSTSRSVVCTVSTLGNGKERDLVQIEFVRFSKYDWSWSEALEPRASYYRLGLHGYASEGEAIVIFPCPSGLPKNGPPVLSGRAHQVVNSPDEQPELSEPERSRALMVLLHSATRIMAEKAGCLDEAGIPAQLPKPAPASDYRMPPSSLEEMEKDFVGEAKAEGT